MAFRPVSIAIYVVVALYYCTHLSLAQVEPDLPYARERVLVRFKESKHQTLSASITGLGSPRVVSKSKHSKKKTLVTTATNPSSSLTHLYDIVDGSTVENKIKELKNLPGVELVEPDYKVYVSTTIPKDAKYAQQWHHPKIESPSAWDYATGSSEVKVCVIDSGIRIDHPDLSGNVIKGWSVVPEDQVLPGPPPQPEDAHFYNYNDTMGHGTHVAGLIGAIGNNTKGVAGTSWKVSMLACRFIWDQGFGYVGDAIRCMELCREEGAHIYSNSWGDVRDYSQVLLSAIEDIEAADGLFVVAAGNNNVNLDNRPIYPGGYNTTENLLSVAATDESDEFASFTNVGRYRVHLAAPGVRILSTTKDASYGTMSGTSMACPVVSGVAAVLQGMAMQSGTYIKPKDMVQLLTSTVDLLPGGYNKLKSGGRLNFKSAVERLRTTLPAPLSPPPPSVVHSPPPPSGKIPPPSGKTSPPPPPALPVLNQLLPPVCGTSIIRGQPTTQSSTYKQRVASYAVNGDCRTNITDASSSCSSTDPALSNPWWTVSLPAASRVLAVSVTTRSDCCWDTMSGAKIMLGNTTWTGPESQNEFVECAQVPESDIWRGLRMTLECDQATTASALAVYLPKDNTSLSLCEVDVTISS